MRAAGVAPPSHELSMIFSCSHEGVDAAGAAGRLSFDAALRLSVAWAGTPGRGEVAAAAIGTGKERVVEHTYEVRTNLRNRFGTTG